MINDDDFRSCVARAALAPSVHNTQPARWSREGDALALWCDTDVGLTVGDPSGRDAALSCGAALEAMVLALSAHGIGAEVAVMHADVAPGQGVVRLAELHPVLGADTDNLHSQLEARFTWRGPFETTPVDLYGWTRSDARLVMDQTGRAWIAERNDWASHQIMQDRAFRRELLDWMRLRDNHPRAGVDGMARAAMRMSKAEAFAAPYALGFGWPLLSLLGRTSAMTDEADATMTAPVIALFHKGKSESPIDAGRRYLRLCLEAASLGLAGWPMAALTDHEMTHAELRDRFGIPPDRDLVQAIRFGVPTGAPPDRARIAVKDLLI